MISTSINRINKEQWKNLVNTSETSSYFQTEACYNLYASLPDIFDPFIVSVDDKDVLKGVIVGYITKERNPIKQILTKRAIINGGPMLDNDISVELLRALLEGLKSYLGDVIYIETRNFNDYSKYKNIFEQCGFIYQQHLNFKIDTSSESQVLLNIGKSRKRDVRTSMKNGIEIIENPIISEVVEYYEILNTLYKTRVKTPLFPILFFEKLYANKDSKFIIVKYKGIVVGGTVCVGVNNVLYEWFACGEDRKYKNIYPSSVATYGGIMYAVHNGYNTFDMMGAGTPNESYGVRDFKAKFGGTLVEHGRFLIINSKLRYNIGKIAVRLMKAIK